MARLSPQSVKRCSRAVIRVTQTSIFFRNDGSNLFEKVKVLKKNVLQTAIQFHVIRKTRLFSLTRLQMKIQHVRTLILERYSDNCRPDLNHCWVVDVLGLEALVFLHLLRKRWFFFILQLHPYSCFLLGRPGLPTPISWLVFWCCLLLHKASMFHDGTVCLFNLDSKMLFMIFDCMSDWNSLASKDCLFFYFCWVLFQHFKDSILKVKCDCPALHCCCFRSMILTKTRMMFALYCRETAVSKVLSFPCLTCATFPCAGVLYQYRQSPS